jgi:hypothetical protein
MNPDNEGNDLSGEQSSVVATNVSNATTQTASFPLGETLAAAGHVCLVQNLVRKRSRYFVAIPHLINK